MIGGPVGVGNVIAFNGADGGVAMANASTGNRIFGNAIFGNSGLGINLVGGTMMPTSVTANDLGDSDVGPNNLQNYPVINEIAVSGADRTVEGQLNEYGKHRLHNRLLPK